MSTTKRVYTSKSQIQNRKILLLKKSKHIGLEMLLVSYYHVTLFGTESKVADDQTRSFGTLPILDWLFLGQCRFWYFAAIFDRLLSSRTRCCLVVPIIYRLLSTLYFIIEYFEHYQRKISTPWFNLKNGVE